MKTLRDSMKQKAQAEAKQEAKWNAVAEKANKIVKSYREDFTAGYDSCMLALMHLGYTEIEADDLLVPIQKKA